MYNYSTMASLSNYNITKLIFNSYHLFHTWQLSHKINNKAIHDILLQILNYNDIINSYGKSNSIINVHNHYVHSIALLKDGNIVSASHDHILKFWNTNNFSCLKTIETEFNICSVNVLPNSNIVSVASDGLVQIWDIKDNFICTKSINHINAYVTKALLFPNNNLACVVYEKDISIVILSFDKDYDCIKVIKKTNVVVSLTNLSNGQFASGAGYGDDGDEKIKIYDISANYTCIKILKSEINVASLLFNPKAGHLISSFGDQSIKAYDANKDFQCICHTKTNNGVIYSMMLLPLGYIAAGADEGSILLFNNKYETVNTFKGHKKQISSLLLLDDKRIVSTSYDKDIIIWDY
jgi:WD40 repeat protein